MARDRLKALLQVIKKIPLFTDLSPSQVQHLIRICNSKTYQQDDQICADGTPSDELYILLSGKLGIFAPDGAQVAIMQPVTTVGEMGIITKQARSASVRALERSNLLVIARPTFDLLLRSDTSMQTTIYRNIIEILSTRIKTENVRLQDHLQEKVRHEERIRTYKRRAQAAQKVLMDETGLSAEQAVARIDDGIVEAAAVRVLIVDDEPEFRRFVADALKGYEVTEAKDGPGALEAVAEQVPDLVITDIKMPGMDGYTLLSSLREEHPELPVIAVSGFVEDKDIKQYEFDSFLEKPFEVEEFRETVKDALAREEA